LEAFRWSQRFDSVHAAQEIGLTVFFSFYLCTGTQFLVEAEKEDAILLTLMMMLTTKLMMMSTMISTSTPRIQDGVLLPPLEVRTQPQCNSGSM
jgi:hypothetical protein